MRVPETTRPGWQTSPVPIDTRLSTLMAQLLAGHSKLVEAPKGLGFRV